MKKKCAAYVVMAVVSGSLCAPQALSQAYHEDYGGTRVILQNQTGLYMPSSTYIGCGTLSRSAQGKAAGVGGSLPSVNMGSHVRTPGDNLYNNDGTDRQGNGALIYQDQEAAMAAAQKRKYSLMLARERMSQARQAAALRPQGNLYIPGTNGGIAGYDSVSAPSVLYRANGTATYEDGKRQAVRQF